MLAIKLENSKKFYTDVVGNKYQYDLTNPSDKLNYSIDLVAQLRDKFSLNMMRDKNGGNM